VNYTELKANIQDVCEQTFTDDQLKLFTQQAEKAIYNTVQFPALRKNVTGTATAGGKYLTLPTDLLWSLSCAVVLPSGEYEYLLNKDTNFIQSAYPNPSVTGVPQHYSFFSDDYFLLGPTPDIAYSMELHYGYYPESIVTAGTTWLGDQFDNALFNGALIEAARFQKAEEDVVANYEKIYINSIELLKNLTDGKIRQDTYRSGQVRLKPR